jgi:hypothetical protein
VPPNYHCKVLKLLAVRIGFVTIHRDGSAASGRSSGMRPWVVLMLTLTAAACGGSSAAPASVSGVRPASVGGLYLCPSLDPIPAYGGQFYPSTFPTPPPKTTRPRRCFASATQASRAGYRQAPTPTGDLLIDGVYLVRPSHSLNALCVSAARVTGLAVPCPTLIPGTPDDTFCAVGAFCHIPGAFVLEGTFTAPPTYHGVQPGGGHLWIIAYDKRSGIWPKDTLQGGTVIGATHVDPYRASFVSFPEGSNLNSGHVALIWHQDGVTYAVSLHGHTRLNQRLDLLIAQHLRFRRG